MRRGIILGLALLLFGLALACGNVATETPVMPSATEEPVTAVTPVAESVAVMKPTATPEYGLIAFATPSVAPTLTPEVPDPTPTAVPTPVHRDLAGERDICRRTPSVQRSILGLFSTTSLCGAVSPRELYRFEFFRAHGILHPGDLSGFDNLRELEYSGELDFVDLSHTPNLAVIHFQGIQGQPLLDGTVLGYGISRWPEGFSFDGLPLQGIYVRMEREAVCQIFRRGTIERVFGDVLERLPEMDVRLEVYLPGGILESGQDVEDAAEALLLALGYDLDALEEDRWRQMYGERWKDNLDDASPGYRAQLRAEEASRIVSVSRVEPGASNYYVCGR